MTQISREGHQCIAVLLPQFHPIPENDMWWGTGFTEWRNVTKSKPKFKGHYQPHLPADLGFYDLRLPESRIAQADLAQAFGITGFCYYHYWFNGKRLLDTPLREVHRTRKPDFPFCICWANENWTRAWNGGEKQVLLQQNYSEQDDREHIEYLLPYLSDERYIRVAGKPLLIVYRASELPNPKTTFDLWREIASRHGVGELCLAQFEWAGDGRGQRPEAIGLDLSIEFAPDWRRLGGQYYATTKAKIAARLGLLQKGFIENNLYSYDNLIERALSKEKRTYPFVRCVTPGFDNSPRREKNATILVETSPEKYQHWLSKILQKTREENAPEHQIVFINAWNEWAEGNHLEPDLRNGHAYLEATKAALRLANWL